MEPLPLNFTISEDEEQMSDIIQKIKDVYMNKNDFLRLQERSSEDTDLVVKCCWFFNSESCVFCNHISWKNNFGKYHEL